MKKIMGFRNSKTYWFQYLLYHLLVVSSWKNYLTFLNLNFLIYKTRIITDLRVVLWITYSYKCITFSTSKKKKKKRVPLLSLIVQQTVLHSPSPAMDKLYRYLFYINKEKKRECSHFIQQNIRVIITGTHSFY